MDSFESCFVSQTDTLFQDTFCGAEYEPIPQHFPPSTPLPDSPKCHTHRKVRGCYMEPRCSPPANSWDPKIRKIKACKLWNEFSVDKTNGIQDENPKWLILGWPHRRPGPSYANVVAYYPAAECCRRAPECPRNNGGSTNWPKAFMYEDCIQVARSKKKATSVSFCHKP